MITKENFAKCYLVLFTISIYMYWFDLVDRMAMQYFLMSILSLVSFLVVPFIFKINEVKKAFLDPLSMVFLGFILFSFISIINSINITESFVRIGHLLAFYITLLLIILISSQKLIKINFILILLSSTLLIDVVASLEGYYQMRVNGVKYTYDYINNLLGLFGNRNIISTGILFRVPLLILLALRINKKLFYLFSFIIVTISFFNVFLLSSRTAFLAIILSLIYVFIIIIFRLFKYRNKILSLSTGSLLLFILPLMLAYTISNNLIKDDDYGNINSRVSSIVSTEDESKNRRLIFYGHALDNLKKNPFLGCGIGNWRILSIKYDSLNMENYVVPYNAHNDILEAITETGIFGGIMFISFFIVISISLYKVINFQTMDFYDFNFTLIFPLPFIIYFTDLNLNFPTYRPFNLYLLLLFIALIYLSNSKINANK